ncbi:hypothetical protein BDP81DRAFT_412518 [Colletotrichum phormii]|uniref:Uncharacterized protein n=1 Tax=Colletotrichum phormii TaxID=359342 RepID=A0AAJ0EJI8_9PEZI|nr:uncharacterized protein BDP81DRAFT_412518 [Colletotrichum phormii]KAK1655350.1 hypothetical protein BDP81DRAFT_412518 [Colletotrichum phormii]
MRWPSSLLYELLVPGPRLAVTCLQGYLRHTRFLRWKTSDSAVPALKLYTRPQTGASPVEKHQDSARALASNLSSYTHQKKYIYFDFLETLRFTTSGRNSGQDDSGRASQLLLALALHYSRITLCDLYHEIY